MINSLLESILRDDDIVRYLQHMVSMKCELNYQVLGELDRHFRGITSRGELLHNLSAEMRFQLESE